MSETNNSKLNDWSRGISVDFEMVKFTMEEREKVCVYLLTILQSRSLKISHNGQINYAIVNFESWSWIFTTCMVQTCILMFAYFIKRFYFHRWLNVYFYFERIIHYQGRIMLATLDSIRNASESRQKEKKHFTYSSFPNAYTYILILSSIYFL